MAISLTITNLLRRYTLLKF